jgi:hypothetical protein
MGIDAEQQNSVTEAPVVAPEYPPAPAQPPAYVPAAEAPAYVPAFPAPVIVQPPAVPAYPAYAAPKKARPAWILPVAIAAVGLLASGALGYLFYSTNNKLEATRHDLTTTQLDLDGKNKDLAAEHAQAAYVSMYDQDLGRLSTDFGVLIECDGTSSCKSAAQAMITDTQAFQSDRQAAKVPASLSSVDSQLGDGLTAEVTALQDLVSAINSNNMDRIQSGFVEVSDATISVFKTEAQLARLVQ